MDEDTYARRLLLVLANPEPTGIDPADPYAQADDGIDRYDGFGTDVVVDWVRPVHDGRWTELEVGFRLVRPWEGPATGTTRVLADPEWLRLSGYAEPAAYAPEVAVRVAFAARQLVQEHRSPRSAGSVPTAAPRPPADQVWRGLLEHLAREGAVREVGPGRLEVDLAREEGSTLVVLLAPEQWADVVARHGDWESYLHETLSCLDDDEHYLVHHDGDLSGSIREELPPVRGRAEERRALAYRAANPDAQLGWYAFPPSGG